MSTTDDYFTAPIEMARVLTTPYELLPTSEIKVWQGKPPVPAPVQPQRRTLVAWIRDEALPVAVIGSTIVSITWAMGHFVGAA